MTSDTNISFIFRYEIALALWLCKSYVSSHTPSQLKNATKGSNYSSPFYYPCLVYNQIGWSIFIGLILIVALMSTQSFIVKAYMQAKIKKMEAADNRMRLMNEILAGIKIVKLYGWEDSFKQRVTAYRDKELVNLKFFGKLQVFMSTMFQSLPMVAGLISFSVYATVGGPNFTPGEITPQRIFVAISLFGLLAKPIGLTAGMMNESASALVSTRRIEKFLLAEENCRIQH